MDFLKLLTDNFWASVVLMIFILAFCFGFFGLVLEAYKTRNKDRQKRMELRNEELRLQIMLEQQKNEHLADSPLTNHSMPKEPSWEEQSQINYDMGYQQRG
ncbi:MAG TPA: hypothetical protein VKU38_06325 [Ktedonobacteraceae bacterium]|nr:hypothetical protein [Ktedonobacteraceae bacterium]